MPTFAFDAAQRRAIVTALLAVRAMVDVLATMVKHDRVGGRLKAA